MSTKRLFSKRKIAKNQLDWRTRQNSFPNVVKFGINESLAHAMKKLEVCYELKKLGKHFYTEAILNGGGHADIFVLDDEIAIEIVDSETERSIVKKEQYYPCPIVVIRMHEEFKEEMLY